MTESEFKAKLRDVPDSHEWFVQGILDDVREFGTMDEIVQFIDENPDTSAGYVVEYSTQLAGLD